MLYTDGFERIYQVKETSSGELPSGVSTRQRHCPPPSARVTFTRQTTGNAWTQMAARPCQRSRQRRMRRRLMGDAAPAGAATRTAANPTSCPCRALLDPDRSGQTSMSLMRSHHCATPIARGDMLIQLVLCHSSARPPLWPVLAAGSAAMEGY